ncbi:hypothetical protein NS376_13160 [Pseudomonas oryzihabitans]|nr:hypothetical protein NS376_13160 [Pseudomonas psychrotolerans]
MNYLAILTCPANSLLSNEDMVTLSMVFPHFTRAQVIELKAELNRRDATFRTYRDGKVYYDMDQLTLALSKRLPAKAIDRLKQLVSLGVCLQAFARTPLSIPMGRQGEISIRE